MADLSTVRSALASQIQFNAGITTFADVPSQITPPCALVLPGNPVAKYGGTLGGTFLMPGSMTEFMSATEFNLVIMVLVSVSPGFENTQQSLDQYLGLVNSPESIPYALALDPTLGGAVSWAIPMTATSYGNVSFGGIEYFGARITVNVSLQ